MSILGSNRKSLLKNIHYITVYVNQNSGIEIILFKQFESHLFSRFFSIIYNCIFKYFAASHLASIFMFSIGTW